MDTADLAIAARGLCKSYPGKVALDELDLNVPARTVHGLFGPNGAGKTTFVRILATLLVADRGEVSVAGYDLATQTALVRKSIALVGQYAAVDEVLSARRNLVMFGRLLHLSSSQARLRADELLEQFDLAEAADRAVATFSGGMRRRLDLAVGMIHVPRVLLLDEPTTGLDPRSRGEVWEAIRGLVRVGTTVLLTTQYLDEADQLADRISVIDNGRVIADGTPLELKSALGSDRVDVVLPDAACLPTAIDAIVRLTGFPPDVDERNQRVSVPVADQVRELVDIAQALREKDIPVHDLALRRPTLDEVFLHLTKKEVAS